MASHISINASRVYLRSDDEERTLLSGQALMSGFFHSDQDVILRWNTGDYALDQISPNSFACPELATLQAAAETSEAFIAWNSSEASELLTGRLSEVYGAGSWSWADALDCLMTTVCTGREVPGISDVLLNQVHTPSLRPSLPPSQLPSKYVVLKPPHRVSDCQIVEHVEKTFAFTALHDNSAWSKV